MEYLKAEKYLKTTEEECNNFIFVDFPILILLDRTQAIFQYGVLERTRATQKCIANPPISAISDNRHFRNTQRMVKSEYLI